MDEEDIILLERPNITRLVLTQLPRIQNLHLSLTQETFAKFAHLLAVRAPHLQRLVLSLNEGSHVSDTGISSPTSVFDFPALRMLSIRGIHTRFAWSLVAGATSTITHLKLRVPHRMQGLEALAMDTLLSTLRSMTRLTTLDLGNLVLRSPLTKRANDNGRAIDCRRLRILQLSGEISQLNWFLSRLQLSPSVNMDLAIFSHSMIAEDEYVAFGNNLARILHPTKGGEQLRPLDHAAYLWWPSSGLPGVSPSTLHVIFSDHDDVIHEYHDNEDMNVVQSGTFRDWEQVEAAFDKSRTQAPSRRGQRALHIWILDTLIGPPKDERIEFIWSALPLGKVHTLFLRGIPVGIPEGSPFLKSTSRTFMNCVCPMLSVRRIVARGWDPIWLQELITPIWRAYLGVAYVLPFPFPTLESLTLIRDEELGERSHWRLWKVLHTRREIFLSKNLTTLRELVLINYVNLTGALRLQETVPRCIRNGEELWSSR